MMDARTLPPLRRTISYARNSVNAPTLPLLMRKIAAILDIVATVFLISLTIPLVILVFIARIPANYLTRDRHGG